MRELPGVKKGAFTARDPRSSRQLDERMRFPLARKEAGDREQVLGIKRILEERYDAGEQHAPGCFCDDCTDADRRCVAPSGLLQ